MTDDPLVVKGLSIVRQLAARQRYYDEQHRRRASRREDREFWAGYRFDLYLRLLRLLRAGVDRGMDAYYAAEEMEDEYDFSAGERGRYHKGDNQS